MIDVCVRGTVKHVRTCLLASTALIALPGLAHAQDDPVAAGRLGIGTLDPQVVISQPGTPSTALDPADVTGVGQMIIDQKNGFLGLCTGTLINPRTVIFAAHCVNESPAGTAMNPWGYGTGPGQLPIGFGFKANNLPGIRDWFLAGANQYKTSQTNAFYNVNQVVYNADSLKLGLANNFLQGDVALATLDTPATKIPTWTILLSALPAPAEITTASGTGYHVGLVGYGNNGIGTTGSTGGIDYRRRVAENFIGILGSLDDVNVGLGGSERGLAQNLYQVDFDDPRRGTPSVAGGDYNLFKDTALPKEGITAPGDSGGPLILDRAFSKPTVVAVLSGGSTYGGQVRGGYGTTSFYQPLYLFWDYIAANNPYRYVGAVAGDGAWTDATHWQTNLDPAYQIVAGGQLVNGLPTAPGAGIAGDQNKFGQVCDQEPAFDYDVCYDVKTKVYYVDGQPVSENGVVTAGSNAVVSAGSLGGDTKAQPATASAASLGGSDATDAAGDPGVVTSAALPAATLANGLPGATNFVPDNIDPDATTRRSARYFDVTLSAAGTTTLGSAVTIDRFTVSGAQSRLNVAAGGSLTSLMEINQIAGTVQVDGTLASRGDYFLMSGLLTGSGRINAPYLTSVMGVIAPGTMGTAGTLTIGGNAILTSASTLLIDLGANGVSDRLAVVATTGANGTPPTDGIANIGGRVAFAPVAGTTLRYNNLYTILTAQGGVTGTFSAGAPFSAILKPTYIYGANAVQLRIEAGRYADVVANTPIQTAYAGLLDRNRLTNYAGLSDVYGILDLQSAAAIRTTLEGLAPRTEQLVRSLGVVATDNMARFYRDHLSAMDVRGGLGGTLAVIGRPVEVASLAASDLPGGGQMASDGGGTMVEEGRLPEDMSGFIAGGYLDGDSRPLSGAIPTGGRDQFNGYYAAAGLEKELSANGAIGFAFSYTRTKGHTEVADQRARGELYQGTLYGKVESDTGIVLDTQVSGGAFDVRTHRTAVLPGATYDLRSRDRALAVNAEVGLGKGFEIASIKVGPRIAARASHLGFTPTAETGGGPALRYDRDGYDSVQGRAGLALSGGVRLRPYASAYYVHEFNDQPGAFGANFAGGVGPNALFALAGTDKNWAEVSAGLAFGTERVQLSVGADTTLARKDVKNQAYRGAIKFRF